MDDSPDNQVIIGFFLGAAGALVDYADNGEQGVDKAMLGDYSVVLMDIQMPVMDGFEATKAIRLGGPPKSEIPIVALTANATRKDFEKCLAAGMNDCIAKPFTPDDLFRILIKHTLPPQVIAPASSGEKLAHTQVDLSYLKSVGNGNPDFIKEMISTFQESIPERIDEIRLLVKDKQWRNLAKEMHKIKPTLMMIGLKSLRAEVMVLEELLNGSQPEGLGERILKVADDLNNALDSLKVKSEE